MYDASRSIEDFLAATAARQPIPGGGSVTALVGALSAAIGEMVVNYSLGKKDLKEFEKNAATLRNEKVKQWTEYILPILTVHLKKAERVAEALGLSQVE